MDKREFSTNEIITRYLIYCSFPTNDIQNCGQISRLKLKRGCSIRLTSMLICIRANHHGKIRLERIIYAKCIICALKNRMNPTNIH